MEIKYSEEDAERDSELLMQESEDIDIHWINKLSNISILNQKKKSNLSANEKSVYNIISSHFQNIKFLKFSKESIISEIINQQSIIDSRSRTNSPIIVPCSSNNNTNEQNEYDSSAISIFLLEFPYSIIVKNIKGIENMLQLNESLDNKLKQLKKDIERDRLLINGNRIVGVEYGLHNVLKLLNSIINQCLINCSFKDIDSLIYDELSLLILTKVSRTHSGGITFQAVHCHINSKDHMLMPLSHITPPLKIKIYMGNFPSSYCCNNIMKWGLVCEISCESIFQIQKSVMNNQTDDSNDNINDDILYIQSIYKDYVLLDVSNKSIIGREECTGIVTLDKYNYSV